MFNTDVSARRKMSRFRNSWREMAENMRCYIPSRIRLNALNRCK